MAESNSQPSMPAIDAFTSLFLAPFRIFGATSASSPTFGAAYRLAGLEIANLTGRRTEALLDVTAKTRQCRNSGDLANVTVEFWQTAWSQQMDCANRIAALFGTPLPLPLALVANKASVARDVLTVPEGSAEASKPSSKPEWADQSKRRAA
jgi:hypothetical protein